MSASEDENRHRKKEALDKELRSINKRLGRDAEKPANQSQGTSDTANAKSGYGIAMRLSSEFISAILVGAAIGYGIDWLIGTKPWAMIVFLLLGFVAGVMNVLRTSGEMSDPYKEIGLTADADHDKKNDE